MAEQELPEFPTKGNRLRLDELWLTKLYNEGIGPLSTCQPEPPPEFQVAIAQFNSGQYWMCHETLEGLWLAEGYPLRLFYHGIIKSAVGLLHLEQRNIRGAKLKVQDAEYTLAPFSPQFMGIQVGRLRRDLNERLALLQDSQAVDWDLVSGLAPPLIRTV